MKLQKKRFKIYEIKETKEKWLLYTKGKKELIELSKEIVYGNLPPVWKFPWQCHELIIKSVADYMIYAEMDGLILFNIPEKQITEENFEKFLLSYCLFI